MEILWILLISGLVTTKMVTEHREDMEYAKKGLDSPRWKAKQAKYEAGQGPAPARVGASGYFAELWNDAWADALAQHKRNQELRQQAKDRTHAKRLERAADPTLTTEPVIGEEPESGPGLKKRMLGWLEWAITPIGEETPTQRRQREQAEEEAALGKPGPEPTPEPKATPRRRPETKPAGVVHDGKAYDPTDNTTCPGCGEQATRSPAEITDSAAEWRCWDPTCGDTCTTCRERRIWARPARPLGTWHLRHTTMLGDCPGSRKPVDDPQPKPQPSEDDGRRTPDSGAATGDVNDIHSCDAQMNELMETLGRIGDQVDVIDGAVRDAGAAGDRMSGFLASKSVPDVNGLAGVVELLNPEALKALYDALDQAAEGLVTTWHRLTPLREAAERIGDADGSATNGR